MSAPVEQVKSAAAQAVADNRRMNASLRTLTMDAFCLVYGRSYDSRTDRTEYARIKWHVKRALNGDGFDKRGGRREGAGRPKKVSQEEA